MSRKTLSLVSIAVAALGLQASPYRFVITADHADCRYRLGEEAVFSVKCIDLAKDGKRGGQVEIRLDDFGTNVFVRQMVEPVGKEPIVMKGRLDRSGFLRVVAKNPDIAPTLFSEGPGNAVYSVGYDPEKIVQSRPRPSDFEAYWRGEQERLEREVPLDPRVEKVDACSQGEFNTYLVSFATFRGKRVYGVLTEPKAAGCYPVLINVPGAGPSWCIEQMPTEAGMIRLTMNIHPQPVPTDKAAAKKCYSGGNYPIDGILKSREDYFYHDVWLGIDRAVTYVVGRGNVDRSRVLYSGGSQGGGTGLALLALNRAFTRGCVMIPAITDLSGCEVGRTSGWPRLLERTKSAPAAVAAAPYFDGANFAAMITVPIRVTVGLSDTTCPPTAVYSGYNVIPSKDKRIFESPGVGHSTPKDVRAKLDAWLRDSAK